MRVGYSTKLSEILRADEVQYGDCAEFQITCPICRAAVFKTVRPGKDAETHFFSHYRADSEEAKECELRVQALAESVLRKWTDEGRAQTLRSFLAVLRREAYSALRRVGVIDVDRVRMLVESILARPDFQDQVKRISSYAKGAFQDQIEDIVATLRLLPVFADKSEFWRKRQAAYVRDVGLHLSTSQARKNLEFILACSIILSMSYPALFAIDIDGNDDVIASSRRIFACLIERKSAASLRKALAAFETKKDKACDQAYKMGEQDVLDFIHGKGNPWSFKANDLAFLQDQKIKIQEKRDYASSRLKQIEAELAESGQNLLALGMVRIVSAPMIGLLAAIPFPSLAGDVSRAP